MASTRDLEGIASTESKLAVGLMSGTSVDGIDAALVEIKGSGGTTGARLIEGITYPYPREVRDLILQAHSPESLTVEALCHLNFVLGELFAASVLALLEEAATDPGEVSFIGSHGQTVCHLPEPRSVGPVRTRATLQIGEAAVISARTGILTVGDFRVADVAAGGEGAPLIPLVDTILLRDETEGRLIQNIGGIANVTVLPAGQGTPGVFAFDNGPGNMVIDAVVSEVTGGEMDYDRDGGLAGSGRVRQDLLTKWLRHPYFQQPPPKSTGREMFGPDCAARLMADARVEEGAWVEARGRADTADTADLVATVTALTAAVIADSYHRFVLPNGVYRRVVVGGGGSRNPVLMQMLRDLLPMLAVTSHEELGIDSDFKEALGFAILAHETICCRPGNLPAATGAGTRAVLGKISFC